MRQIVTCVAGSFTELLPGKYWYGGFLLTFQAGEIPKVVHTARAVSGSGSIFTEADTIDELKANIMDALRCHFDQEGDIPTVIHLHCVKDETLRYTPASWRL